ncbi:MAG: DUF1292 domain-containing protein [Lachnospiraceae bacterium]|nr:DUF1292 domain-containing protein [Lachnospiraceae bacterium]
MEDKILFIDEDGNEIEFYVIEQTSLNGIEYLLVADSEEEEADCYLFKDISDQDAEEAVYVPVEDDTELDALGKLFAEILEDVEIR